MSRYDKAADRRDQQAAEYMRTQTGYYSQHSDKHLENALRFARGCAGSEARVRSDMIRKEMARRRRQ